MKKLYRTEGKAAMLAGVCGGLAEYFNIDPSVVRLIAAALIFAGGLSLWVYIVAAFVVPKKSQILPDL